MRAIPLLGWLYLAYGAVRAVGGNPIRHRVLRIVWWIDAFLSIVVHTAQIPSAVREGDKRGHSRARTALLTFVFGLTWWKTQPGHDTRSSEEIR
ncbi:MAG: hypothetical protein GX610_06205 [Rhodococcus sp.]|nr:hypothetical protein [Rhodococcus sp. (in: high G+C Gram-positive bacteria)]